MAIQVNSFADFANRMQRMTQKVQTEVKEAVEFYAGQIEVQAIRDAPGPGSQVATQHGSESLTSIVNGRGWTPISQAIGYKVENNGYSAEIFVEKSAGEVAVWVEMGCGQDAKRYLATVPPEWREEARKYIITGRGTIMARPYLLPAFMDNKLLFIQEIKDILKNTNF